MYGIAGNVWYSMQCMEYKVTYGLVGIAMYGIVGNVRNSRHSME